MQLFIFHWTRVRSYLLHLLSPSLLFCRRNLWLMVVKIITKKFLVLLLLLMLMLMLRKALTTGWWRLLITLLQQLLGSFVKLTTFWSKLRGNLFIALGYVVPLAMFHGPSQSLLETWIVETEPTVETAVQERLTTLPTKYTHSTWFDSS